MNVLSREDSQKLIDIYTGKTITVFNRPVDVFYEALSCVVEENSEATINEIRKFIDALDDWTRNPTIDKLYEVLGIEQKVSGKGVTVVLEEAMNVASFCTANKIPFTFNADAEYTFTFKEITRTQYDAIVKASCISSN